MKRLLFFTISVIVFGMMTMSCGKNEPCYSCNPELDAWAKKNLKEIRGMSADKWFDLDYRYSKPAYVALMPYTKFKIWETKLKDVLRYDWSKEEESHIRSLLQFAITNKRIFLDDFHKDKQLVYETRSFLDSWAAYAINDLKWDKELVHAIFADPHLIADTKGGVMIKNDGVEMLLRPDREGRELDCNCNLTSMWYWDCVRAECNEIRRCGGFCLFMCNGRHNLGEPPDPNKKNKDGGDRPNYNEDYEIAKKASQKG